MLKQWKKNIGLMVLVFNVILFIHSSGSAAEVVVNNSGKDESGQSSATTD